MGATVTAPPPPGFKVASTRALPGGGGCFPLLLVNTHEDTSSFQSSHFLRKLAEVTAGPHTGSATCVVCMHNLWEPPKAFSPGLESSVLSFTFLF